MTLVPGTANLEFTVDAQPTIVCPGAKVMVTIGVHNRSDADVVVSPRLVITEVLPHIVVAQVAPISLPAGGSQTVITSIVVPLLPPGTYNMFVANGASFDGATISVRAPSDS